MNSVINNRRLLLAAAVVIVLGAIGWTLYWLSSTVVVPDVQGRSIEDARLVLRDAGLALRAAKYAGSASSHPGTIVSQSVSPGSRLKSRGGVSVVVSGFRPVEVPDYSQETLDTVRRKIGGKQLEIGTITHEYREGFTVGSVIRSDPAAGTQVQPGTAVHLVLAKAPQRSVPNVVGLQADRAKARLEKEGFHAVVAGRAPYGKVLSQDPKPGANADEGATVSLVAKQVRPKQSDLWSAKEGDVIYVNVEKPAARLEKDPEDLLGNKLAFDGWSFKYGGKAFTVDGFTDYTATLHIWVPYGIPRGEVSYGDVISLKVDEVIAGANGGSLKCTYMDVWK